MLGQKVKHERKEQGLSQEALAALSGTTAATICRVENGIQRPSLGMLKAISKALGVSIGCLMGEE